MQSTELDSSFTLMRTDATEAVEKLPSICDIKVHSIMCTELIKLVDRIDQIIPEIEAAKPRCSSGIESLCLLISGIDKAKLLIRDCCQSSKLYLALTGSTVLSRCKKTKNLLEQSLSRIQNMVPVNLASKISQIMGELRVVEFSLNPSEEEAGKAIRSLLDGHRTGNRLEKESENEWVQIAAQKLKVTSSKALLIEQRSIKKLIGQLDEGTSKQQKKQILSFLLHLLNKYGKSIASNKVENHYYESQTVDFCVDREKDMPGTPPEEFKCSFPQKLTRDRYVIDLNPFIQFSNDVNKWEDSTYSVNSLSSMCSLQLPDDYS